MMMFNRQRSYLKIVKSLRRTSQNDEKDVEDFTTTIDGDYREEFLTDHDN